MHDWDNTQLRREQERERGHAMLRRFALSAMLALLLIQMFVLD